MLSLMSHVMFIKHLPCFSSREMAPSLSLLENRQESHTRRPAQPSVPGEQDRWPSKPVWGRGWDSRKTFQREWPIRWIPTNIHSVRKMGTGVGRKHQRTRDICWWFCKVRADHEDSWWRRRHSLTRKDLFCHPKGFKLYPKSQGKALKDFKRADPLKG